MTWEQSPLIAAEMYGLVGTMHPVYCSMANQAYRLQPWAEPTGYSVRHFNAGALRLYNIVLLTVRLNTNSVSSTVVELTHAI